MKTLCKTFLFTAAVLVFGVIFSPRSHAYTFTFDKIISGGGGVGGYDFGTVVFTDNGPSVNIDILLDVSSIYVDSGTKILGIYLNHDPNLDSNSWSLLKNTIDAGEDQQKANGFSPRFDLKIPDRGNLNALVSFSDTISKTGADLDPSTFAYATGGIYVALHIGGLAENLNGSDSVWVGASPAAPVPEPATVLLIGSGLIGMAGLKRRFRKGL